jgi:hypothetical protein
VLSSARPEMFLWCYRPSATGWRCVLCHRREGEGSARRVQAAHRHDGCPVGHGFAEHGQDGRDIS